MRCRYVHATPCSPCRELLVIDLLPAAIKRGSSRLQGRSNLTWRVADIASFTSHNSLDVIIVSEVLYYLAGKALTGAIGNLVQLLAPGGVLIFGSARDATCARWGLRGGAKTCITEFRVHFGKLLGSTIAAPRLTTTV